MTLALDLFTIVAVVAETEWDAIPAPRALKVSVLEGYRLEVEFADHQVRIFDVSPLLEFPVYQPLKSRAYFEKAFVSNGIVQWPNEEDISPDTLYLESRSAS